MYDDLFVKLEMNSRNFSKHKGINLHGFDESETYPWGVVDLPVQFTSNQGSKRKVNVQFVVIPCKSIEAVPSTIHLKMKYHDKRKRLY